MSTVVRVKMARGGYMNLEVTGTCHSDSDGAGRRWTEVKVTGIFWPGGGKVADKNIADMTQVEEAFEEALKSQSEEAYNAHCERYDI